MKVKQEIREKIIAAANALAAEGNESPTNDQVRDQMGGGSLSHISPVMREWRESRKAEVVAALEMPGDLKKAVETALSQIWTTASKLAQASMQAYRQEADEAISSASHERDEALSEVQRLESRLDALEEALEKKEEELVEALISIDKVRELHTKAETEKATLSSQIEDRDNHIQWLKEELTETKKDSKALQAELIAIAKEKKSK